MPKPGRLTRKDEAEARRAQILDQAIRLIGFKGYRGFTLQQLATQCGITNGGVLYHFPSKEDVLTGVLEELERRMVEGITTHIAQTIGIPGEEPLSRDVVLQIMRGMLSRTSAEAEVIRLLTMLQIEALDPDHPAHERIMQNSRSTFDRFSVLFEPLCEDPRIVARQALAMMNGLYLHWLEDPCFDLIVEWDRAIEKLLPDNARGKGE